MLEQSYNWWAVMRGQKKQLSDQGKEWPSLPAQSLSLHLWTTSALSKAALCFPTILFTQAQLLCF